MSGSRWMCTLLGLIDEYSGDLLQRVKKGSLFIQCLCLVNLLCMMFILVICEHCFVHFFSFQIYLYGINTKVFVFHLVHLFVFFVGL